MLYKAVLLVQLVAVNAFGVVEPTCNKKGCYLGLAGGNHFCLYSLTEDQCESPGRWTEHCGCEELDLEGCYNPADNTCSECQDHDPTTDSTIAEGKKVCAEEGKNWKTDCTETMCEKGAGHHTATIEEMQEPGFFPTCKQAACYSVAQHKCLYDVPEIACSAMNGTHGHTWYANCPCEDASAPASSPASSPTTSGADGWWTGLINKGSCYIHGVGVTCNKDQASCAGSHYPSGFVSGYSKCCHCKVGCDSSQETAQSACTYSDDASVYE